MLVDLELDHLGVDQDELDLVRARLEEDGRDEGVDGHALARAGRPRDQEVRHGPQVVDDGLSVDVLAEGQREERRRSHEALGLDDVAQRDDLAASGVGDLDADARPARQSLDADRLRRQSQRQVLGEAHHLVDLDTGGRAKLVGRDDGARMVLGDLSLDSEFRALGLDHLPGLGQVFAVHDSRGLPLFEKLDVGIGVALDDEGQTPLRLLSPRSRGGFGGRSLENRGRLLDREPPGTGNFADRRRAFLREERRL